MDTLDKLPEGTQPQISPGELIECEEVIRADPGVRKLAADVGNYPAPSSGQDVLSLMRSTCLLSMINDRRKA